MPYSLVGSLARQTESPTSWAQFILATTFRATLLVGMQLRRRERTRSQDVLTVCRRPKVIRIATSRNATKMVKRWFAYWANKMLVNNAVHTNYPSSKCDLAVSAPIREPSPQPTPVGLSLDPDQDVHYTILLLGHSPSHWCTRTGSTETAYGSSSRAPAAAQQNGRGHPHTQRMTPPGCLCYGVTSYALGHPPLLPAGQFRRARQALTQKRTGGRA